MVRLFLLFLMLPWWAYVPVAAGVVWLGEKAHTTSQAAQAERAAAIAAGMPSVVDLSAFSKADHIGLAGEVHVQGWINSAYNYTLVERTNGVKTDENFLFMLFGSDQGHDAKMVRAAIVMNERERDAFIDKFPDFIVGATRSGGPMFAINGTADWFSLESSMVEGAIADEGLQMSPEFIYLTPFLQGRDIGLRGTGSPSDTRMTFWLIAAGIAMFGVVKRFMGQMGQPARKADGSLDLGTSFTPRAPGGTDPAISRDYAFQAKKQPVGYSGALDPNSPLGRIAAAQAARDAAQHEAQPSKAKPARAARVRTKPLRAKARRGKAAPKVDPLDRLAQEARAIR